MDEDRRFLVLGAGGHGRVVVDLIQACGGRVVGFVDRDRTKVGQRVDGIPVALDEESLLGRLRTGDLPDGAEALALGIGSNAARAAKLGMLPPSRFPVLVHPMAAVSPSSRMGPGTVVLATAVVNPSARLGSGVIVNSGAIVEHDCVLGDAVHVSPGAVLAGGVQVGARSWVGAGATVIEGVRVGEGAIVGAGAAVVRDVPDGTTVVGVPARPLLRQ